MTPFTRLGRRHFSILIGTLLFLFPAPEIIAQVTKTRAHFYSVVTPGQVNTVLVPNSTVSTVDLGKKGGPNLYDFSSIRGVRGHLPAGQPASGLAGQAGASGVSDILLVVSDVLGREVATLLNQLQTAGQYTATFDGTRLSSGLYFSRLTSGGLTATRTMLLLR